MKLTVNNKAVETQAANLQQLADELALPAQGVAMAVNNRMVGVVVEVAVGQAQSHSPDRQSMGTAFAARGVLVKFRVRYFRICARKRLFVAAAKDHSARRVIAHDTAVEFYIVPKNVGAKLAAAKHAAAYLEV